MKLLLCKNCYDVIRLIENVERKCLCGKVSGKYVDKINAVYKGNIIPIGIDNNYLIQAIKCYPNIPEENSITIKSFLIPKKTESLKKIE